MNTDIGKLDEYSQDVQQEVFVHLLKRQYEDLMWGLNRGENVSEELEATKILLEFNMFRDDCANYLASFETNKL